MFQLTNPPGSYSNTYLWDMTNQGSGWCSAQDALAVYASGAFGVWLNSTQVMTTGTMPATQLTKRHLIVWQSSTAKGTTLWLDGTQLATNSSAPNVNRATGTWTYGIGNGYNVNAAYYGEAIFYPQALNTTDMNTMTTYLRSKYSI